MKFCGPLSYGVLIGLWLAPLEFVAPEPVGYGLNLLTFERANVLLRMTPPNEFVGFIFIPLPAELCIYKWLLELFFSTEGLPLPSIPALPANELPKNASF